MKKDTPEVPKIPKVGIIITAYGGILITDS